MIQCKLILEVSQEYQEQKEKWFYLSPPENGTPEEEKKFK